MITAGSYDLLAEVVCESDEHLLRADLAARSAPSRASLAPRRSCTSGCASRPTRGACAEPTPVRSGHDDRADRRTPRPPLDGDLDVDVAIVGAGFTGLWTAYYLAEADPTLRIAVLEAEVAGFGASGRNGGWCSALFPASLRRLAGARRPRRRAGPARAPCAATRRRGRPGARRRGHRRPLRQGRHDRRWPATAPSWPGPGPRSTTPGRGGAARTSSGCSTPAAARERAARPPTSAGRRTPRTARRSTPLRLVRGLADARRPARGAAPRAHAGAGDRARPAGHAPTRGTVRAGTVVRATEGYTAGLPGAAARAGAGLLAGHRHRAAADRDVWDEIGLRRRETFTDHRHLIIYGQRTADDRLVFGGRGAPYHFGSRIRPGLRPRRAGLRQAARDAGRPVPGARAAPAITHAWGGALGRRRATGAPRSGWTASTGLGWAGGYVGDGVSTTNLAGRTLRDLVLGRDTELVRLPWVGHQSPRWEPEPLRWLGVNAGLRAMTARRRARSG